MPKFVEVDRSHEAMIAASWGKCKNAWEKTFLASLRRHMKYGHALSGKQVEALKRIYGREGSE